MPNMKKEKPIGGVVPLFVRHVSLNFVMTGLPSFLLLNVSPLESKVYSEKVLGTRLQLFRYVIRVSYGCHRILQVGNP
jgi:hypothetical protein